MRILALLAIVCAGIVSAIWLLFPEEELRYRLTVEAEVDGKSYTGSSVIAVTYADTTRVFGSMGGYGKKPKGEAVVLDFGARGLVFGLLEDPHGNVDWAAYLPLLVWKLPSGRDYLSEVRRLKTLRGPREVPPLHWPKFVRFRDTSDPRSVELLHPDLAPWFGPGARLTRMTIEPTDEAVTTVVISHLPWLANRTYLGGAKSSIDAPLGLQARMTNTERY
jgi:hypothetical protein